MNGESGQARNVFSESAIDSLELVFPPALWDMTLLDDTTVWLVGDGWRVTNGVMEVEVLCRNSLGGPDIILETLHFPDGLVDDTAEADEVMPPPHPQDGLEGVVLVGGFEFWSLPLSSGGSMRVTAQGCRRVGGDLQFTVLCVGDPVFDIVLVQLPLGVIEAGVERVLLAEGRPPVECVSKWAPVWQEWPQYGASSVEDVGPVE